MRTSLLFACLHLLCLYTTAQENQSPTQIIRGVVMDQQSEAPLIGANVVVVGSDPFIGSSTDIDGNFRLENVPVGRQTIRISYLGYEPRELPNILVTSGKEMILNISLQESLETLQEVVIEGEAQRGESINKMATVSARTFSVEETKRYAGAIEDPSRMASSYAGVGVVEGDNDLVIRGNSPRGMLWRMEGVEIPNPNHFSNQGASGGPISMLSSNMMTNSEFFTGAFPAEYGNAYSGVFDIALRKGNNEQREYTFGVSVLGTDLALEGPFSRNYGGSYLVNYRYSTLAMFSLIGLDIVGDLIPKFQDISYNINLPTSRFGNFSVFGLGGSGVVDDEWRSEDYDYKDIFRTDMGVTGIKHTYLIGDKTLFKTVVAAMGTDRSYYAKQYDTNNVFIRDSYEESFEDKALRVTTSVNHKFNSRHTLKAGVIYNHLMFEYLSQYYSTEKMRQVVDFDEDGQAERLQSFAQWQYRVHPRITLNTGLHHTYFNLNDQHVVEPRFGAKFQVNEKQAVTAGIGIHSSTHDLSVYFVNAGRPDGTVYQPNKDLNMMRAAHYVLGYERNITENVRAKAEVYYQQLWDVPIEDSDTSSVSGINSRAGYATTAFVNEGTGYNYGAEITLERYFTNQWFFMMTSSLFDSKYTAGDGIERNTRWNANYVNNLQFGKEFNVKGPKRVFGVSAKGIWAGGARYTPILLEASRAAGHEVLDNSRVFDAKMPDYFRLDVQLTYRINREKTTHFIKLDVQNATNRMNYWYEDYNPETGEIVRGTMLGILPVLSYKIQF